MFRRLLLAAALVIGIAPAAEAAGPEAVLKLEPHRTRWTLEAEVAGRSHRYLLDSAGGLTLVSKATAEASGCKLWGRLTGFNMFGARGDTPRCDGVRFTMAGGTFTPPTTGLVNMAKLNPGDADLDGIISLDMFEGRAITLDLAAGRLVVESPESLAERTRAMIAVPARLNREVQGRALSVFVAAPTTEGQIWLELDTGNGGTVLVSKQVAPLLGLDAATEAKQALDFPLAPGVRITTADALTPDLIMDGNLGMPFLRHWLVTLDLREGRVWLAPNPTDPPPA